MSFYKVDRKIYEYLRRMEQGRFLVYVKYIQKRDLLKIKPYKGTMQRS